MLAGVVSFCCALPASPSDGPAAVSQPPASTSGAPPVMLGEIFARQLESLDTLQVQVDALMVHNKKSLSQSKEAETALQISLTNSAGLLRRAQGSLRRAERNRWIIGAAALAAGAILGGLLL